MPEPANRIRLLAAWTLASLVAGVAFAAAAAQAPAASEPAPAGTSAVAAAPEAPAEIAPAAAPAPAPRLKVPAAAAPASATVTRPDRGALMSEVEARYGAPSSRQPPVGQPPITRWDYPGLVVYFENERVIHSVVVRPAD